MCGVAVDVTIEGLGEDEQLSIALKTSVNTALEEQAAWEASFIYDRARGNLPASFVFLSLSGVVILMFHSCRVYRGFTPSEVSGTIEVLTEAMEVLASTAIKEEVGLPTPTLEAVAIVK